MFARICTLFNFWLFLHIPVKRFARKVNYTFNHLHLCITMGLFLMNASFVHESSIAFYVLDFVMMNTYKCITRTEKVQYKIHHTFAVFFLVYKYPLMKHVYFITELSNIPLAMHHYVTTYFHNNHKSRYMVGFMYGKILWYFYFRCVYPIHLMGEGIRTLPTHIMVGYFGFYLIGPYHSYRMIQEMIKI